MVDFVDIISEDISSRVKTVPRYVEYDKPEFEMAEMLRYSGIPADKAVAIARGEEADEEIMAMIDRVKALSKGQLSFKAGYMVCPLPWDEEGYPVLPFVQHSDNLRSNLAGCEKVLLFAATIGAGIDMLIRRYERTEVKTGLFLQGFGAERAESLANAFNADAKKAAEHAGYRAHARFSPGFGDLPLSVQPEFLALLDATRRMGITLSESCLMAPSKSVTAIIGLEKNI